MEQDNLPDWPDVWPPLPVFWGPLITQIASSQHISAEMEHQVIVRFKNHYGVKISKNFLHESLYSVAILRFFGRHQKKYCLVKNSPYFEANWYLNISEVLSICAQVAKWNKKAC